MKMLRLLTMFVVFLSAVFVGIGTAQEVDAAEEHDDANVLRMRAEWFYHQRAYPLKHIPAGARQHALKQRELIKMKDAAMVLPTATPSPSWVSIGPEPSIPFTNFGGSPTVSGRVSAIAVDPTNASIVYLGGANGGVWKSTDAGNTWTPLTDNQPSLSVGAIAIDPSNHNTIYVGTGEGNYAAGGIIGDSYYGAGILKSTDGGGTWAQITGPFVGPFGSDSLSGGAFIGTLAVSPSNSQVLLAGLYSASSSNPSGLYRTADGGTTWALVLDGSSFAPNPCTSVVFDPTNENNVYAALGNFMGDPFLTNGVYKSTDGGQTWTELLAESANVAGRIVLAIAPSSPTTLYASVAQALSVGSGLLGVYKTTDGGTTWGLLSNAPNFCDFQCSYDMDIKVAPNNANVVYATGMYTYSTNAETTVVRSLDGGSTWSLVGAGANGNIVHTDGHALTFSADSSTLYVGSDGGAWSTTNVATSPLNWNGLNGPLAITEFYNGLAIDPTNVNIAFAGAQDNGTQKYSGTTTWNIVACGDAGYNAIDLATPTTVYSACSWANQPFIQKSTSSGNVGTYSAATTGIDTTDRASFIPPLVMDPINSSNLYTGTYRLYQTTNGAASWTAISPDLTSGGNVSTIAVAPSNNNTIYTGSDDGLIAVTNNALLGTSSLWFNISPVGLSRAITHIAVDPGSASTAYVTYSGFSGFADAHGHVFKTTNGGSTWTDISGNLPNIPVNVIVLDPDIAGTLYVGTDIGAFVTSNGGTSWSVLGTGLPDVAVLSLAFHHATRTLMAATHGRSVWEISLATTQTLTVTLSGTGSGTVTSSPSGINCPGTCSAKFNSGTAVTLPAAAGAGSSFAGWSGACSGTGTCNVTMSAAKSVTATFNLVTFPLTVTLSGTGSGTVTTSPSGINCPGTCSASFNSGTGVILTAAASAGSTFAGWSGACTGTSTCNVTMTAAKSVTATFNLSGGPVVTLSPTSLSFGTVVIGTTSVAQAITLRNTGTATLTITAISITGTNSGDFLKTGATNCGSSLAIGASCTISVAFKPTTSGARSAAVSITDNAPGSPQQASLSGTGTTAELSPTSLNFGTVALGVTSTAKTVTLTNVGTTTLTITSIAVTGANASDLLQTATTCGASLAAAATCTISVDFKPIATGTRTAALSVTDSAAGSPQQVPLTGVGTTAELSPISINFGTVALGVTTAAKTVTLTNVGTATLTISSISITGTSSGDYLQTATTCGASLAAAASCTVSVEFTPTATGTRTAALSVSDNAAGSPQQVPLTGIGTTAKLSAVSLSFGSVTVGTTSAAKSVTLTNVGTTTITISLISITGTNAGDFLQSNNCGSSLAATASCTINVQFKPTATGSRTGALSVTDNAAGSPQKVTLSGKGI